MTGSLPAGAGIGSAVQDRSQDLGSNRQAADSPGVLAEIRHRQGQDLSSINRVVNAELELPGARLVSRLFLEGLATALGLLQCILTLEVDEAFSLLFQGDLGVELVFLDLTLLLDGCRSTRVDRHIG